MKWINKNSKVLSLIIIFIGIIWFFVGPIVLTQQSSFGFAGSYENTGVIGDTIGGITSPVISLVSAILLYFALIKQIDNNESTQHEANFRIIFQEISSFRDTIERHTYKKHQGEKAISNFSADYDAKIKFILSDDDSQDADNLDILLNQFDRILYLYDNLKTSNEYKDVLIKDLQNVNWKYFRNAQSINSWNIDESITQMSWPKGKLVLLKRHLNKIEEEIIKRNEALK